jgi:hypothetical protein
MKPASMLKKALTNLTAAQLAALLKRTDSTLTLVDNVRCMTRFAPAVVAQPRYHLSLAMAVQFTVKPAIAK